MLRPRLNRAREWLGGSRRRLATVILVLVAMLGILAGGKSMLAAVRGWRAERLIVEAEEHGNLGNWLEMQRAAQASLQIKNSIEALRLFVRACEKTGDPNRLRYAATLFGHPLATVSDRSAVMRSYIDVGDLVAVSEFVKALEPDEYDPEMRLQVVRFLVGAGDFRDAALLAELEAAEGRHACDLVVARGLIRSGQLENRGDLNRRLTRVFQGGDREGALQATQLLASLPAEWVHPDLAALIVSRFRDDPTLAVNDRLAVDLFQVAIEPDSRASMITEHVERLRGAHLEPLVGWLMRLGEATLVVDLTEDLDSPSASLFRQRVSALAALERFDDLARELEQPPAGIPDVIIVSVRAAVADLGGRGGEAVALWRQAFEMAARNPSTNDYFRIAGVAERNGNREKQMEALALALERPLGVPPPFHQVKPVLLWLYENGDSERLIRICSRLLEREPGSPILVNMLHYLRLLRGDPSREVVPTMKKLVNSFPKERSFRSTLALALLKEGKAEEALAAMAGGADPADDPPAGRIIHAAVLQVLGREKEEESRVGPEHWDSLPRFEADSLRTLLKP